MLTALRQLPNAKCKQKYKEKKVLEDITVRWPRARSAMQGPSALVASLCHCFNGIIGVGTKPAVFILKPICPIAWIIVSDNLSLLKETNL